MKCPSCGTTDEPVSSEQQVRDYIGRPATIVFYGCACGYSSWDRSNWRWDEPLGSIPSEISVAPSDPA